MILPKIVVIGNSYSAVSAFYILEKYLAKSRQPFDILLITNNRYYFFKDLLSQYLCGSCGFGELGQEFREVVFFRPGIHYLDAKILDIDFNSCVINTSKYTVKYDYLILAPNKDSGSDDSVFSSSCSYSFNSITDILQIKKSILNNLEACSHERDLEKRKTLLAFSVIGAKTSGIEIACSINDYVTHLFKKKFSELNKSLLKINLFEQDNLFEKEKSKFINSYLLYALNKKRIKILGNSKVTKIEKNKVIVNNEKEYPSSLIVFSGMPKFSSLLRSLRLQKDKNDNVLVDLYLKAQGTDNVFVIGEASKCMDLNENQVRSVNFLNKEAKVCASNIIAKINNDPLKPISLGAAMRFVSLGFGDSIVEIENFCFSGIFGWLIYRLIHIWYFLGWKEKIKTFVSFLLNVIGFNDDKVVHILSFEQEKEKKDVLLKL